MRRHMRRNLLRIVQIFIVTAGVLSCTGANLYKDMASNKTSDEALYEDAQKLIDSGDYTAAISKILTTTATFQGETRVKESLAGAYAARCGLEFLTFVSNLSNGGASSFFQIAMNGFVGVSTSNYADCDTAEGIIEGMGSAAARSTSQNFFLLFLEMAKIGNRVRSVADVLPTAVGDGTVDAGFNCRTSVPIADAQEIIESFSKLLENMTALTAAGATVSGTGSISSIAGLCGAACTTIDYSGGGGGGVDELDAAIIVSRALINSQSFGVGSCNNADPTTCVCP